VFDWFAFVDDLRSAVEEINLMSAIERLKLKAAQAKGVVPRMTAKVEAELDAIIGSEAELDRLTEEAAAPHKAAIAETKSELNGLKDALNILSNGPHDEGTPVPPVRGYPQ
jgi:hypothetical protein